jgi:regulator of Ty1 transposition protein 103
LLLGRFQYAESGVHKKRHNNTPSSGHEPPTKISRRAPESEALNSSKENEELPEEAPEVTSTVRKERRKSENNEVVQFDEEGRKEVHITLSPKMGPARDPPEPEELIKALQELDNAASCDGLVREKIAQLPPEVSDVSRLAKISGII